MNKYRNICTQIDGITFDSRAEARRYGELKMLQQAGEIQGFARQVSFLLPGEIRYRPDFLVCDKDGTVWAEDVKGFETAEFKLKQKLWRQAYPWMQLHVVKG